VNSALLAFAPDPQLFFPSATIKCAHFHGIQVQKPIPDYKEFEGTVFEVADEAVNFVLSKISLSTDTREKSNQVETIYEIPRCYLGGNVLMQLLIVITTVKAAYKSPFLKIGLR
jgi:predicted HTH transcriptional regulator